MELVLKHIFARDVLSFLKEIANQMRTIVEAGGEKYISIVLQYSLEKGDIQNKKAFFEFINTKNSEEVGDTIMTLGEQLREEGRIQGLHEGKMEGKIEGKIEVALRLLSAGIELGFVANMTGITLEQLKVMQLETVG